MKNKIDKKTFCTLMLYAVITLIGTVVMSIPSLGYLNPIYYASMLLFIFSFFNVLAYFLGRNESDYELLYFCLINILVASFLFISEYADAPKTLGTGFLMYTVLILVNKVYHTKKLKDKNDSLWIVRAMATVLIMFLATLTIQNFYREITTVQTLMIGYYFITFGIVSVLETIVIGFVSSVTFTKVLFGEFDELRNERRKKKKSNKKSNENVKEFDEIVEKIEIPKKTKKKIAVKKQINSIKKKN